MVKKVKTANIPSIVFFGSGPVAARSLELLLDNYTVEAVITKPRPAWHRSTSPVIDLAEENNITTYFVSSKNELDQLLSTTSFSSSLGVLIDFGIIVSVNAIDSFKRGIINSHFSLLPQWRGADPITFSLLSGQETTGVSLMLLTPGMDEGPLIAQHPVTILPNDTSQTLTQKLIETSDILMKQYIDPWLKGDIEAVSQDSFMKKSNINISYSRKIEKKDGIIDWHESAEVIERKIRAFLEWPKCATRLRDVSVIITKAHVVVSKSKQPIGTILVMDDIIMVACGKNYLAIDSLKPEGRKEMSSHNFLLGYKQKILE